MNLSQDRQSLHQKFVQLGIQRKNLTRQLQALLPEIYKQEIYKQKGCATIHEYAWKYAGFSKALTDKIIQVGKHVENLPYLKKAIEEVGIHKVGIVSTLANAETDEAFAKHVTNMSKSALFEFSKEIRHNGNELKCHAVPEKIKIELDDEVQILFLQLKKQFQKEFKREFSNQEALKLMLERLIQVDWKENLSVNKKKQIKKSIPGNGKAAKLAPPKVAHLGVKTQETVTRYIPAATKQKILQQYKHKCAYPNCHKPYELLHHRERFAENKSHDSIIPLCKEHHEFAHNGLIKNENKEKENWQLEIKPKINFIDKLFLKYKTQY